MNGAVVALIILTGVGCESPLEQRPGVTVAYRVPCAIVLHEQTANPFKLAQQVNVITPAKPKAKRKKRKRR